MTPPDKRDDDNPWLHKVDPWKRTRAPGPPDLSSAGDVADTDPDDVRFGIEETFLNESWSDLLRRHMPFHQPTESDWQWLCDKLFELEGNTRWTSLESDDQFDGVSASILRHRVRLMEKTYKLLRLDRYANAPANRGWMNLFRAWSNSLAFNKELDVMRRFMTRDFVQFYDNYLRFYRDSSIDEVPVPHPWDKPFNLDRNRLQPDEDAVRWISMLRYLDMDVPKRAGAAEGETDEDIAMHDAPVPGVFLDSGLIDGDRVDQPKERADDVTDGSAGSSDKSSAATHPDERD